MLNTTHRKPSLLQGFTDGVMKVGPYAGRKVSEVKPIIKEAMMADGHALPYSEPEKMVSCFSGLRKACSSAQCCRRWQAAADAACWQHRMLHATASSSGSSRRCWGVFAAKLVMWRWLSNMERPHADECFTCLHI
jgi:hypothetical protein